MVLKGDNGISIIRTKDGKTSLLGPVKDYVFDTPFLLTRSEKGWRFQDLIDFKKSIPPIIDFANVFHPLFFAYCVAFAII